MIHITRLFPKIKINLGETPEEKDILNHGFDIKVTPQIKQALMAVQEGDYLTCYPATDENGNLRGINLKVKK